MRSKLFYNMLSLLLVQLANYLPPLIVLPYLSRVLGADGFGLVSIVFSASAIIYIVTDYGFSLSSSYWVAKHRANRKNLSHYIGAVFFAKTILLIIVLALSLIAGYLLDIEFEISDMKVWVFLIAFSQAYQCTWFFQGIEKMKSVTVFMVASKIFYMMFVFLFVTESSDINSVFLSYALSGILATIISIGLIYQAGYHISCPSYNITIKIFRKSTPYFLSRASVGFYTSANAFIVGSVLGVSQAALYSSAEKLYQAGQSLISPISQSLFPYLARTKDVNILLKIVFLALMPLILGCTIFWLYSVDILLFIFGDGFENASGVLRVFMLCSIVTFITGNFGYPAFSIYGRLDIVNKSVYFSGALQLISLVFLYQAQLLNIESVAISILSVESLVMSFRVLMFWRLYSKGRVM